MHLPWDFDAFRSRVASSGDLQIICCWNLFASRLVRHGVSQLIIFILDFYCYPALWNILVFGNNFRNSLMSFSRAMFHSTKLKAQPSGLHSKVFLRSANLESCNPVRLLQLYKLSISSLLHDVYNIRCCTDSWRFFAQNLYVHRIGSSSKDKLSEWFGSNPFDSLYSFFTFSVFPFLRTCRDWCLLGVLWVLLCNAYMCCFLIFIVDI